MVPVADTLCHDHVDLKAPRFKVAIIGAGVAGLFTGMIFDHLKEEYNLHVEYDFLEAGDKTRVGGGIYTHHITPEPHDYYGVGAMRYPDS